MSTIIYNHSACLEHDPGEGHPERPDRLRAVAAALEGPGFEALERREAPLGEHSDILRVHDGDYLAEVLAAVPDTGRVYLDPDTALSPGSGEAALRAVGAIAGAVDAVARGQADNAFCAVRPPGHHAEPARAMGFCLFNNVAIGALRARDEYGFGKVAVIDFDVHHGNGTQAAFEHDATLFYASTHQYPHYPGTGAAHETGVGNILNLPLPAGSGSQAFRQAFTGRLLPALDDFGPEFVLISAGFDAHAEDPLAGLELDDGDYAWVTRELLAVAARHAGGRLVSTLEGGYALAALGRSVAVHVAEMLAA
ncbi:MAG: histone deacetylase family protein [Alphaproteobacteria bacterium]|jgi:acetoin utilization deacetylase AcuC-like enzyme|nr:acetoin utilization protein [Rhodospirillaceae bacterium]MDP6403752.1 histone deacetylase family protein [Alphaproteobacteria bacterium]MDP6624513.1 histone deacetylase family protein [Alphaproteobacteria bacterium]|tara:strand:+ start:1234 stop:2160 length:927 start_codon:yes stop_codon:yes gene_type:complete